MTSSTMVPVFNFDSLLWSRLLYIALTVLLSSSLNLTNFMEMLSEFSVEGDTTVEMAFAVAMAEVEEKLPTSAAATEGEEKPVFVTAVVLVAIVRADEAANPFPLSLRGRWLATKSSMMCEAIGPQFGFEYT